MENLNIRFDEGSRNLMRNCMDELQNDTIKALAEDMLGGILKDDGGFGKTHGKASLSWTKSAVAEQL